jgi:hypothetical protein
MTAVEEREELRKLTKMTKVFEKSCSVFILYIPIGELRLLVFEIESHVRSSVSYLGSTC